MVNLYNILYQKEAWQHTTKNQFCIQMHALIIQNKWPLHIIFKFIPEERYENNMLSQINHFHYEMGHISP